MKKYVIEVGIKAGCARGEQHLWNLLLVQFSFDGTTIPGDQVLGVAFLDSGESKDEASAFVDAAVALNGYHGSTGGG